MLRIQDNLKSSTKKEMIMKKVILLALLILGLSTTAKAQTTIEMQASPYNCGRASTPLYCYGIPVTVQIGGNYAPSGMIWVDVYPNNTGFIWFNTPPFQTSAQVTGATRVFNSIGQVTSITIAFQGQADPEGDGDSDSYVGSLTLNFSYYYSAGGGGRGGAGAGWRFTVTGGKATISSN